MAPVFPARAWGTAHHLLPQTVASALLAWPTKTGWAHGTDPAVGDHSQETKDSVWGTGVSSWGLAEPGSMLGSQAPMTTFPLYLLPLIP